MKVKDCARFFDRTPVTDPVTGDVLFKAQFTNFDGSKRDAFTAYRRVMSVAPEVDIPAARVVNAMGATWIVGDGHADGWSELHRRKFITHMAAGEASVWTLAGYLADEQPNKNWADLQWVTDRAEEEESSDWPQMYVAIMPNPADVEPYSVIEVGSDRLLARSIAHHASGFLEARGLLQSSATKDSVSLVTREYSPAQGKYVTTTTATVRTLRVRWQEMYRYDNQLDDRFQEGDEVFAIPAGTPASTATSLQFGGQAYSVLSVTQIAGAQTLHARPA